MMAAGTQIQHGPYSVAAMRRQARFMRGMLADRAAYDSEAALAAAVGEYRAFLMVHVESGSRPPSWPQNEVNILIDSVTSH